VPAARRAEQYICLHCLVFVLSVLRVVQALPALLKEALLKALVKEAEALKVLTPLSRTQPPPPHTRPGRACGAWDLAG
jgi:hypothetical protein